MREGIYCIAISTICLKIIGKGELDMVSKIGKVVLKIVRTIVALIVIFYFGVLLTAWLTPFITMLVIMAILFVGFRVLRKK